MVSVLALFLVLSFSRGWPGQSFSAFPAGLTPTGGDGVVFLSCRFLSFAMAFAASFLSSGGFVGPFIGALPLD